VGGEETLDKGTLLLYEGRTVFCFGGSFFYPIRFDLRLSIIDFYQFARLARVCLDPPCAAQSDHLCFFVADAKSEGCARFQAGVRSLRYRKSNPEAALVNNFDYFSRQLEPTRGQLWIGPTRRVRRSDSRRQFKLVIRLLTIFCIFIHPLTLPEPFLALLLYTVLRPVAAASPHPEDVLDFLFDLIFIAKGTNCPR
jgi:hypothetical protein